jgi:hypothetical protein
MRLPLLVALYVFAPMAVSQEATYANPVDGKTYTADWKTYVPKSGVAEQTGRVVNSGVRLLSSQADFERNTTAQELAKLISYIQELLSRDAEGFREGGEILLDVSLSKDAKPQFKMSYQGDLQKEFLQRFYDSLSDIDLQTKQSTVALQVHFVVKSV